MSTVFNWDKNDINNLLASCKTDGIYTYIKKYIPKDAPVLESGCGLGRYVRFLKDRGWDTVGLEINNKAVKEVNNYWPDLKIICGDSANSPFKANYFGGVISLGVIEHWVDGSNAPLNDIYRTLKPGGVAVITVPCMSTIRKIKKIFWWNELVKNKSSFKSWIFKNDQKPNRLIKNYLYSVYPYYGDFFEYRLTKKEFKLAVEGAGFNIIAQNPSAVIDGLYHELNPKYIFVTFKDWKFYPNILGRLMNASLSTIPFFHPHMQLIVAQKPLKSTVKVSNER